MSPFQLLVYIRGLEQIDCVIWEKFRVTIYVEKGREFYGEIWRGFAHVKCGSIMCGFRECYDCRPSHLLCDLPRVLDLYVVELVLGHPGLVSPFSVVRPTQIFGIKNKAG